MHGMHARMPKNFVLEDRLERYGSAIELAATHLAGQWTWACHPLEPKDPYARYRRLWLDLGCGKGAFAAELAAAHPDMLIVAVDAEPFVIAYAAQKAVERGLPNLVVVPATGAAVAQMFACGEVDVISINYPTPYPRARDAHRRLVILERLLELRGVLAPTGTLRFKTDSQPLRDFALTQFELAGYAIVDSTDDACRADPCMPASEYEVMTMADGAPVYRIIAAPVGDEPPLAVQTAPLSLVCYLPDDLASLAYVPRGMEGTVTNLRNYRARRS